jgi:hypothetical protein
MKARRTNRLKFLYLVHKWQTKKPEEIHRELGVETLRLATENPEFALEGFSKPKGKPDGSLEYTIKFKRK